MTSVIRTLAVATVVLSVAASSAFATEHSVNSVRALTAAPAAQIAAVHAKAPVMEASLMGKLLAYIQHIIADDGGLDNTIHRG